jgi:transcriptional regulator GlxA family with amidase domain
VRIGVLLFDQVDLLDFGGPYEVFLTADRLLRRAGDERSFEVLSLTLDGEPVTAYGGVGLVPDAELDPALDLDVLIVPGAIAIDDVTTDTSLVEMIRSTAERVGITTSVCTGAFLLGDAGLLEGRPWTTHFEDIDMLAESIGCEGATRGVQWVDSGEVVTAGGLSAGLGMALHLVERLADRDLAVATARQIEYAWDPDGGVTVPSGRSPETAPRPSPDTE